LTTTLLRDWVRNREAVFFAFLFPVLLLIIFSLVFAGGGTEFAVGVQNNDVAASGAPTELSDELVTALESTEPFAVKHVDRGRDLTQTDQIENATGYQRVLVIPEGFDAAVRERSGAVRMAVIRDTIELFGDQLSDDRRAEILESIQRAAPDSERAADPVTVTLLTTPDDDASGAVRSIVDSIVATFNDRSVGIEDPTVALTAAEHGEERLSATDYYLPAFIVAMILFNGVMTVPSAVAQLKQEGTLKRLAATPLRKREWVLANVIQQSILAVLITGVMIALAWLVFGVTAVPGPLSVALIIVGAVAFSAFGMIVGGLIREPGSAISLGGGITLPLLFISGVFWELDLMPAAMQSVAEFSPVTHYHRSLRQLLILDSTSGVWATFGLLLVMAVVFLVGAVRVTQWQEFG
jgi:ABC-2 type transport system permease protein